MGPKPRFRRRRGYSLGELAVVLALSALLSGSLATALNTAARTSALTARKANAQQQFRELGDLTTRFLRSATPLASCVVGSPQACTLSRPAGAALVSASPTRIEFYAYTSDRPANTVSGAQVAPDRVVIGLVDRNGLAPMSCSAGCLLQVTSQRPVDNLTIYQTWLGSASVDIRRSVTASNAPTVPKVFTMFTADGQEVCAAGCSGADPTTIATLNSIAYVVFDPLVSVRVDGQERVYGSRRVIGLPSKLVGGR